MKTICTTPKDKDMLQYTTTTAMSADLHVGWVYAVRSGNDVKIGFTTNADPHSYLHTNYARTYSTWTVLQLLQVADCRHAEKALLFLLRQHLQHDRHEIVQCDDDVIFAAFNKVSVFFHDTPDRVAADMERARQIHEDAKQLKSRNPRKRPDPTVSAIKKEVQAKLKQQRLDALRAQIEADAQRTSDEKLQQVTASITQFLTDNVEKGQTGDFVKLKTLYHAYNEQYNKLQRDKQTSVSINQFKHKVEEIMNVATVKQHNCYNSDGSRTTVCSVILDYNTLKM